MNGTRGLPPGPRAPRLLQTLGFIFTPRRFLDRGRRRYGDVVCFGTLFDPRFVVVFDPELVKQVFRAPPDRLRAGEANALLGIVLGQRSLLLLDGEEHLRQRRLMLPPFHGERMRAYEQVIRDAADREIDSWPLDRPFALLPSMQSLTLDVIVRAVFGIEQGARQDELKRRLRAMITPFSSRAGVMLLALVGGEPGRIRRTREFRERRRRVDELIYDEIARRRGAADLEERQDVFSLLLLARDQDGRAMTDQELRDELVTLLVAGHETTATGLAWAFDLLLRSPRVLGRLREAIDDGDDEYQDAVVKEALRIRPVVPAVGRVVRGGHFELGPYSIPPGVEINPSIAGIHRREDRYPDPDEFRPERFLEPGAPDTYSWLPFGGGTRRCLGAAFASFEMKTVIETVLTRARLEPVGRRPEAVKRQGITMAPGQGTRAVLRERRPRPVAVAG